MASGARPEWAYVVTCEHGGNRIPARYRARFAGHEALLATHRGYDPGALSMARTLARALDAPLFASTTSRLLVELNRSPGRQFRESPVMANAPPALREEIVRACYLPYRRAVETFVAHAIAGGRRVLHVSSHSFTPKLRGTVRRGDIGLLYDPARDEENALCMRWQHALHQALPQCTVRRNYPYLGRSDGITSWLRKRFTGETYVGVELEVNQKHVHDRVLPAKLRVGVAAALLEVLAAPLAA